MKFLANKIELVALLMIFALWGFLVAADFESDLFFPLLGPGGSASAPTYSFLGDTDTGIYSFGDGRVTVAVNGERGFDFIQNPTFQELALLDGGTAYTMVMRVGSAGGVIGSGTNIPVDLMSNSTVRFRLTAAGDLLPILDNTYDIGLAGFRPRYVMFGANSAGAPAAADCDTDGERGRLSIDTTNNRLYVCNGATRGWDYTVLTN